MFARISSEAAEQRGVARAGSGSLFCDDRGGGGGDDGCGRGGVARVNLPLLLLLLPPLPPLFALNGN